MILSLHFSSRFLFPAIQYFTNPFLRCLAIHRVQVDADILPSEPFGNRSGRTAAEKRIQHHSADRTPRKDARLCQTLRKHGKMPVHSIRIGAEIPDIYPYSLSFSKVGSTLPHLQSRIRINSAILPVQYPGRITSDCPPLTATPYRNAACIASRAQAPRIPFPGMSQVRASLT